ncbi:MAG: peroxiredoxin [Myxococcota bacterium]|jgi:peroxiredoxin
MADVNSSAPAFEALNQAREKKSLQDYKGKKLVLAFFPAAFTGVCQKELCTFQDSLAKFNDLNAAVVGVSVDAPFSNKAFADQNSIAFDILSDYSRSMVAAYGVEHADFAGMTGYTAAKRSVFVINEDGVVTWKWVADNPGQEPDYDTVSAQL